MQNKSGMNFVDNQLKKAESLKKRPVIKFFQQVDGVRLKSRNNFYVDTNVNCKWTWKREKNNYFTFATEGIFWANIKMKLFFVSKIWPIEVIKQHEGASTVWKRSSSS